MNAIKYEVYNEELEYTAGVYDSIVEAEDRACNTCRKHNVYQRDGDERECLPYLLWHTKPLTIEVTYNENCGGRKAYYTNLNGETLDHKTGETKAQGRKSFLCQIDSMGMHSLVVKVKIVPSRD